MMGRVIVIVALLVGPAGADRDAAAYFRAGQQAYELGDFATAVEALHEAHARTADPETAFSYAQALRRLYYIDLDATLLERSRAQYVAYLDAKPHGPRSRHARQHLATIDRLLGRLAARPTDEPPRTQLLVTSEVGTAIARIDDGEPVAVPTAIDVPSGRRSVRFEAPGHDAVTVDILAIEGKLVVVAGTPLPRPGRLRVRGGGATVAVDGVRLEGDAAPLAPGRHHVHVRRRGHVSISRIVDIPVDGVVELDVDWQPTPRRRLARGMLAAATGLGILATASGVLALRAQRRAVAAAEVPRNLVAYDDERDRRDRWRAAAVGIGVGALITAASASYLYLADDGAVAPTRPTEPRLQPLIGPDTLGVAWSF